MSEETVQQEEQVKELTPKEVLAEYLKDEKTKDNLLTTANILLARFPNWFTLAQMMKKTPWKNPTEGDQILQLLCLADLAGVIVKNNAKHYKITLSKTDKADLLELELKQIDNELELVQNRKEILIKKIADLRAEV